MNVIRKIFQLDTRAIALARIFIAFCILWDLITRAMDLRMFYTDQGVLPLHSLFHYNFSPYFFSFHAINGHWLYQAFLFLLHFVFALGLLLGYKTKWTTFLCLIFSISLNHRNPLILQGGDDYLQIALIWLLFLPAGDRYSLDSAVNHKLRARPVLYSGMASAGLLLLVFSMYVFSALEKSSPEWHEEGSALYYALSLDQLTRPMGHWLYPYANILTLFTRSTWYFEILLPFLLFIPIKQDFFRSLFFVLVLLFHCSIALLFFIGLFPIICISIAIVALPPFWMNKLDLIIERHSLWFRFLRKKLWKTIVFFRSIAYVKLKVQPHRLVMSFLSKAKNPFLAFCILLSMVWNVGNVVAIPNNVAKVVRPVGELLALDQDWGMFAPGVFKDDGWLVFEGVTVKKKTIEIFGHNNLLSGKKPENVLAYYKNDRWRKFTENYIMVSNIPIRRHYCRALLINYNNEHTGNELLDTLKIFYVRERSLPDYQISIPEKIPTCTCSRPK